MSDAKSSFECAVDARLFHAASLFVADEVTRYYLSGVHVAPHRSGEGVVLSATTGKIGIQIYDQNGIAHGEAIVQLDKAVLAHCKKCAHHGNFAAGRIVVTDGLAAMCDFGNVPATESLADAKGVGGMVRLSQGNCLIDGTFPDLSRVMPKQIYPEIGGAAFKGQLIKPFAEAFIERKEENSGGVAIFPGSVEADTSPHIVLPTHGPMVGIAVGVIMPMRHNLDANSLPEWYKQMA